MKEKTTKMDVAVIVARFQVHSLSEAHIDLIETVRSKHNKVIIFLGLSPVLGTRNNPLDFESRKQMILEKFPDVNVLYIKDVPDDKVWSKKLDEQISDMLLPNQTVALYGGRDSFISHYYGKFPTIELEATSYLSGTELRKDISSKVKSSADFRAGVIWATHNRWPSVQATVDVAIYDFDKNRLLLIRKNGESRFRFVGGFAQPDSDNFEEDARREVMEEAGVEISDIKYIDSFKVDDWRFRNEIDKIKSLFFIASYTFGYPRIQDTVEIAEARWFELTELVKDGEIVDGKIVEEHVPLLSSLCLYLLKLSKVT